MRTLTIKGETLAYTLSPGDGGPSLLLLHGSGGNHQSWPLELRQTKDLPVLALDLPGHGHSGGRGRDRVEAYADCIEDLVSALGLQDVAVAGHSLGGAIALTLGWRGPEWLSRLVLVGTGSRLKVAPAILDGLSTDFEKTVDVICEWAYAPEAPAERVREGKQAFLQCDPKIMHGDFSACNRFDISERLPEIQVPALVLSGSEDRLTPVKYGRFLREGLPDARLEIIQGGGHMMALEKPGEFTELVLGWVTT